MPYEERVINLNDDEPIENESKLQKNKKLTPQSPIQENNPIFVKEEKVRTQAANVITVQEKRNKQKQNVQRPVSEESFITKDDDDDDGNEDDAQNDDEDYEEPHSEKKPSSKQKSIIKSSKPNHVTRSTSPIPSGKKQNSKRIGTVSPLDVRSANEKFSVDSNYDLRENDIDYYYDERNNVNPNQKIYSVTNKDPSYYRKIRAIRESNSMKQKLNYLKGGPKISSYLGLSILACILCPFCGIVALCFSAESRNKYRLQDYDGAFTSSLRAKAFGLTGVITFFCILFLCGIGVGIAVAVLKSQNLI